MDIKLSDLNINSSISLDELKMGVRTISGGGGTSDYNNLTNLPKINNVSLKGNLTTENLGIIQDVKNYIDENPTDVLTREEADNKYVTLETASFLPTESEVKKNTIYIVNSSSVELPDGYTPLEVIKSKLVGDVGSCIELPFKYNATTKFEIDTKLNVSQVYGAQPQGTGWDYGGMIGCKGGSTVYGDGTNNTSIEYGNVVTYKQIIEGTSTKTTITSEDGEIINLTRTNSLSTYATQNYSIGKITRKNENFYPKEIIFYYMKIKINDVLTYDLIPAKRDYDDTVGLYDKVNNQFYSSITSADFVGTPVGNYLYLYDGKNFNLIGANSPNSEVSISSYDDWVNPEIRKFNIIAHRGLHSSEVEHENTIDAFEKAFQVGYKYIECDVIATTDGFVVHHDKNVNGYSITTMTTDAVLNAIPYIPTVESVLLWAKERNVCIDLDTAGRVTGSQLSSLYALVKKHNMLGNVVFTSYQDNLETLKANGETNCNVCLTYMNTTPTETLISEIPNSLISVFNHFEISINYSHLTNRKLIDACHKRNLWCRTWTITTKDACDTYINMGIDKIFVDADTLWQEIANEFKTSTKADKVLIEKPILTTLEIEPNKYYQFSEVTELNITLKQPTDTTILNEYMFEFVSGETATTLTLPDTIKWLEEPSIEADKTYQCSIVNNIGVLLGV